MVSGINTRQRLIQPKQKLHALALGVELLFAGRRSLRRGRGFPPRSQAPLGNAVPGAPLRNAFAGACPIRKTGVIGRKEFDQIKFAKCLTALSRNC